MKTIDNILLFTHIILLSPLGAFQSDSRLTGISLTEYIKISYFLFSSFALDFAISMSLYRRKLKHEVIA